MKTKKLFQRLRHLEVLGKTNEAAATLVRELGATQTFASPAGNLTVPDYRRQIAAVEVAGLILLANG